MNIVKDYLIGFLLQIQFFTRIPIFVNIKFDEEKFAKGVVFAPLIGLIIGGIMGLSYLGLNHLDNRLIIAIILVFIEIILTGGLHLDGLADTCDGFFSGRPREKILEIMKDSRIGTNGTIALILTIVFKIGILYSIDPQYFLEWLLIFPVLSRLNIVWSAFFSHNAHEESTGMGGKITELTGIIELIIATAVTLIIGLLVLKLIFLIFIGVSILFCLGFTYYSKMKIGGVTGDVYGAVIELSEVVILFSVFIYGIVSAMI